MSQSSNQPQISRETIFVAPHVARVKCDGGGGALGHPEVTYAFDNALDVTCLYCGRHFVKK